MGLPFQRSVLASGLQAILLREVSQKVLTAQLREMEQSGLLTRTVYPEVLPRVEYTLTELGCSLKPILDAMWNWGEEYKAKQA
ncbi:MAG: helix-turn-helix transcriptional regulator [Oscillospiraceae bacterium]|nr:helix-turn-helix transcriptional regulator [Oscillospiraceae bacterium]MBP3521158.1 helix-turn-helix transcriptional regulator [Oscillospiraceae bacterium]